MSPSRIPLPVPETRSSSDGLTIAPNPEFGFPGALLHFCIWVNDEGVPAVDSATLRFMWPDEAPARFVKVGEIDRGRAVRVLDGGQIAVELDSLGRVDNVEATAYAPGGIPPLATAGSSTGKTSEKLTIDRTWIVVVAKQAAPRAVQRDAKK